MNVMKLTLVEIAQNLVAQFADKGVVMDLPNAMAMTAKIHGYPDVQQFSDSQCGNQAEESAGKIVIHLLFGESETRALTDAQEEENADDIAAALEEKKTFEFSSQELMQAFLDGVEEGCGWMEFANVTQDVDALTV